MQASIKHDRSHFIPTGALKIADKQSDAVAYVARGTRQDGRSYLHVVAFCGKRQKPDMNYTYNSESFAQKQVESFFVSRRQAAAYAKKREERAAPFTATFEVGATYYTRSLCDHDCIYRVKIIKRTERTVWIDYHGKVTARRIFRDYNGAEAIEPFGSYSMSPTISANKREY